MNKPLSTIKVLFLSLCIILASCSEDGSPSGSEGDNDLAAQQNAQEERIIPVSELNAGITIEAATKNSGTPPAPNSNLSFSMDAKIQEAFQNTGFSIPFSADEDIDGAYIVFKDAEGNASGNYYDVPASQFYERSKVIGKKNGLNPKNATRNMLDENLGLDVNFSSAIQPGEFCYDICVYSGDEVSQIQSVCLTVEAWGGNADVVGEWIFDRRVPNDDDQETLNCTGGGTVTADYEKYSKNEWIFVLEANGDYYEIYDEVFASLDYDASSSSCTAIYESDEDQINEKFSGKWAYNESEQTLTVIDFAYENFLNTSENETFSDGDVYFDGISAKVVNNELVLTETFDGETYTAYFKRK